MKKFGSLGPGLLVVAAFIGPGTVTTASVAGANFGPALLWAVVFSTLATLVLQEMCARLGVVSRHGLGEALRITFHDSRLRVPVFVFVVVGISGGNAAFETGNITGAALGLGILTGLPSPVWAVAIGSGAGLLLALGVYRHIERILVLLVAGMSVVFILTAILACPSMNPGAMLSGLLLPSLPDGSGLLIVALIGTTVVPYNLFCIPRPSRSAGAKHCLGSRHSALLVLIRLFRSGLAALSRLRSFRLPRPLFLARVFILTARLRWRASLRHCLGQPRNIFLQVACCVPG